MKKIIYINLIFLILTLKTTILTMKRTVCYKFPRKIMYNMVNRPTLVPIVSKPRFKKPKMPKDTDHLERIEYLEKEKMLPQIEKDKDMEKIKIRLPKSKVWTQF